jgi:hypothetical protein
MGFGLSKIHPYQLLFALCVAVPYLNMFELTFAVWALSAVLTLSNKYSMTLFRYVACFAAILGIAIVVMFFKSYYLYYIIRDITYMVKPIIGLILGYQLCKKNTAQAFDTIVITGFLIAVIHIIVLLLAIVLHHAFTLNELRFYGGYFSDFEVYAFIILLFHERFKLAFKKNTLLLLTVIVGVSWISYFARTNFIQFVILFMALKGYFRITRRSLTVIASLVVFVLVGYSAILSVNPRRNGPGIEALLYKIKIAPTEPFKTKINVDDWKDFNDNYRSYENIHTVRQMRGHGADAVVFGEGLGSRVDLKKKVFLGDMYLRFISILHNGYMTVFLKSGLIGVFIYLYWIVLLFKQKRSKLPVINTINLLMIGTGIFLIFSNWVFMGVYNLLDNKSLLIGFILCYSETIIRRETAETHVNG